MTACTSTRRWQTSAPADSPSTPSSWTLSGLRTSRTTCCHRRVRRGTTTLATTPSHSQRPESSSLRTTLRCTSASAASASLAWATRSTWPTPGPRAGWHPREGLRRTHQVAGSTSTTPTCARGTASGTATTWRTAWTSGGTMRARMATSPITGGTRRSSSCSAAAPSRTSASTPSTALSRPAWRAWGRPSGQGTSRPPGRTSLIPRA
mmetsp:Transcript_121464/g.369353  ORF Transcript_121464/g.369353 Transcript_121464/m.369353 type:complete len:207 (-) Transcript_121464:942-1562(-)